MRSSDLKQKQLKKEIHELVLQAKAKGLIKPVAQAFQDYPDETITHEEAIKLHPNLKL